MKIGILGGSFDPIHIGHMTMAIKALNEAKLDEIWLIPAGHSPNKNEADMTSCKHRYNMCKLAIENVEPSLRNNISVSDIEMLAEEKSYTYRTLQKIKEINPDNELYFIMGGDSLDYFEKWYHPEIIAELATIVVMVREGFLRDSMTEKIAALKKLFPCDIILLTCDPVDVSSTEIRKLVSKKDISKLNNYLFENVISYINDNRLYIK